MRQRIGSRWSGHWSFWALALLVWCVNSTVLLGSALPGESLLAAAVANAAAATLILAGVALWRAYLAKLDSSRTAPLASVLATGAALGLIKGVATYTIFWTLTGVSFTWQNILQQSFAPVLIGLWLMPTLAVAGDILASYSNERELLISERVAGELRQDLSRISSTDISAFVSRARATLSQSHSPHELNIALTTLAEHDVRPMSHELWQKNDRAVSSYGLSALTMKAVKRHEFPSTLIAASLFVSLLSLNASQLAFSDAFIRSIAQSLLAWAIFSAGRLVPFRGDVGGPVTFFLTPACVVVAIDWFTLTVFEALPGVNGALAGIALFLALCATALLLGVVFGAQHTHAQIREELDSLHSAEMSLQADEAIRLIRRRETAELLHGYVHNQFLSAALRVSEQPESRDQVRTEINDLLNKLETGSLAPPRAEVSSLTELGASIRELWGEIVQVQLVIEGFDNLNAAEREIIDRVLHELVSNAHRHGDADRIDCSISISNEALLIVAQDNGAGQQEGKPGLGSHILTAVTDNSWIRESAAPSGTLVRCRVPRLGSGSTATSEASTSPG